MWIVEYWEYERDWDSRIISNRKFSSKLDADAEVLRFNKNSVLTDNAPDWYVIATGPFEERI